VIAAAQLTLRPDPRSGQELRASGARVRELMGEAAAAGAVLVHSPRAR
jgi:hypothetical protein